jgi:hypothetical protein
MTPMRALKIAGGWIAGIGIVLGWSYWSERPKYNFEQIATEAGSSLPGVRLIGHSRLVDPTSPVTWFWPPTTTYNYAMPDPIVGGRFYVMSLVYELKDPGVWLVDADCNGHTETLYDLDEPETQFPARDLWGEPVVAPNGKTYRRMKSAIPLPAAWLKTMCETDWSAERKEAAAARLKH